MGIQSITASTASVMPYTSLASREAEARKNVEALKEKLACLDPEVMAKKRQELIEIQEQFSFHSNATGANANAFQKYFDTDQDGTLSKAELETALGSLQSNIANKTCINYGAKTIYPNDGSPEYLDRQMRQTLLFGQRLLDNFDAVAGIDKQAGISQSDLSKLAGAYGDSQTISYGDFTTINMGQGIVA